MFPEFFSAESSPKHTHRQHVEIQVDNVNAQIGGGCVQKIRVEKTVILE